VPLPEIQLANISTMADGSVVEWEAIGAGEPLLWIEGGPGFWAHFGRPDVALFTDRFRCHLVNAPGCGRTSPPPTLDDYGLDGHVRFFESFRQMAGLGPVTVVGHSWGGLVAAAYAATVPDAVARLVVIDGYAGGGSVPPEVAEAERDRAFDRVRERPWFAAALAAFERTMALDHPTEEEAVTSFNGAWPLYFADPESPASRSHIERLVREHRSNAEVARVWDERFEAEDHRATIARIRCPTLVVVGVHDFICGPAWNRALADVIAGATYVEIPGVGHIPGYEDPDTFRRVVADWLAVEGAGT
jgi:pimeloyl-ACP methyl ester carboxylesterase